MERSVVGWRRFGWAGGKKVLAPSFRRMILIVGLRGRPSAFVLGVPELGCVVILRGGAGEEPVEGQRNYRKSHRIGVVVLSSLRPER